ncbi:MAG: hypothetical protein JNL83_23405 [Myxococcales bacterium]|nr:hypothetical protein [Myxococcales bacterium]
MRTPVAVAAMLLVGGTAGAWVSDKAATAELRPERSLIAARGALAGWQGRIDRDTGALAELWGSYVPAPGAVADPERAEAAARSFLGKHLGLAERDFRLVANHLDGGLRTLGFQQVHRGVEVVGGQVAVFVRADRVFAAASQARPGVALEVPARSGVVPTARALDWIGSRAVVRSIGARVVLPVDGGYRVADRVEVETRDQPGRWDVYVAPDGTPLAKRARFHLATGTMVFDVGVRYPLGARQDLPARELELTADGIATTTDPDGVFTWPGTSAAAVSPGLAGPRIAVTNAAGPLATAALTAQPGMPVRWSVASDPMADAQLTAFVHASIAKQRARVMMPSLASWLDTPLAVSVNEDPSCNAMSDEQGIHFFKGGPQCENTARLADVVAHEFGHQVHEHAIIPGVGFSNSALSEGVSDFFAATLVEDNGLGRGFLFDDSAIRDLDPVGSEAIWPRDRSGDSHITGLIIGGTLWDLRKALIAELGPAAGRAQTDTIFAGVLQRAPDIVGSYLAARIADDDDGDLGNGTPHGCAIEAAFGKHGLAGSGFMTTQVLPPVVDGTSFSVPVVTPQTSCVPPKVTSVMLHWRVGTVPGTSVAFAESGTSWKGSLPTLPDGTLVRYQLEATLDDSSRVFYPDNPADPEYTLMTGEPQRIWCEHFDADPRWSVLGTDWQWGMPPGISLAGDPTVTRDGTAILGTDLTMDGKYATMASSSVTTPPIDITGYDEVHLQFWRWLAVEDALYDQATVAVNGATVWTNVKTPRGTIDHVDREWRFVDIDVTAHAATPVLITWAMASDLGRELGGWSLDEVCLVGLGKRARCGDNIVDDGEECDGESDCRTDCTIEGDGGCCSAGTDPRAPLVLAAGVLAVLARRRRR